MQRVKIHFYNMFIIPGGAYGKNHGHISEIKGWNYYPKENGGPKSCKLPRPQGTNYIPCNKKGNARLSQEEIVPIIVFSMLAHTRQTSSNDEVCLVFFRTHS